MAKVKRLNKVTREFNVGISTIVEFLADNGHEIDSNPNTKISEDLYGLIENEFSSDSKMKKESKSVNLSSSRTKKETVSLPKEEKSPVEEEKMDISVKVVGKIDLTSFSSSKKNSSVKKEVEAPTESLEPAEDKTEAVSKTEEPRTETKIDTQKPSVEEDSNIVAEKPQEDNVTEQKSIEVSEIPVEKTEEPQLETETETEKVTPQLPDIEETAQKADQESEKEEPFRQNNSKVENNVKVVGKIDLASLNQKTRPDRKSKEQKEKERKEKQASKTGNQQGKSRGEGTDDKVLEDDVYKTRVKKLSGPTVVGKIKLPQKQESDSSSDSANKKKRKRIRKDKVTVGNDQQRSSPANRPKVDNKKFNNKKKQVNKKEEVSEVDVQKQIKETLSRLTAKTKNKGVKYRREKRDAVRQEQLEESERQENAKSTLKTTEFISVSDLATMMDVQANEVISSCMSLGLFVSINQRLDAETISLIAEEFGFDIEFVSVEIAEAIDQTEDSEEDLKERPPIVTVMGHVDHGKTSLLDNIRKANVIAGEAGGITQHIAAYSVRVKEDKKITFLDTPGHEAFTAMRARGAQVTDIAIIVVAADDNVMPQTIEAINHASAAGVPIVFAINKIDKAGANPDKIKEELANMNYLIEEWGGKFQSQEISAKFGKNIEELLEKVLLEAEMLELKANPNKNALGTIVESELDKGRGYVSTILVQTGTLKVGDILLAGHYTGRVKAMFNERNQRVESVGPSEPVVILGLNGAPQAGDKFNVMTSEREAKEIALKREQLQREQEIKTQKHITLDEIGRRIAIGNFQELNVIIKGDVDGSIEALADSLIKQSTDEIHVNVIHKAVGQVTESDIMLASASDAIIIGFQVRPSAGARKLAEKEGIDIRLYSIIYDAINELKDAMSGMLSPEIKEEITGSAEVQETFKITKVGTIAGCLATEGKIYRNSKVRVIRDGIVVYTGLLGTLKRFKEDVKEVARGYECGLNIENYNDVKVGDVIEAFEEKEIQRTL